MSIEIPSFARRWMSFVDGENFTFRAQHLSRVRGFKLVAGDWYEPESFVWFPYGQANHVPSGCDHNFHLPSEQPIRSYYYATATGDENRRDKIRDQLRACGFEPSVFARKDKGPSKGLDFNVGKSKGLDITVARDILAHGFRNNYDMMVLLAGDADYVPLVDEVKRLGKIVGLAFFEDGLSPELKRACDWFLPLDEPFEYSWTRVLATYAKAAEGSQGE